MFTVINIVCVSANVCHCVMFSVCESDALSSMSGLHCLVQGVLYNELKDRSAAEKVHKFGTLLILRVLFHKQQKTN